VGQFQTITRLVLRNTLPLGSLGQIHQDVMVRIDTEIVACPLRLGNLHRLHFSRRPLASASRALKGILTNVGPHLSPNFARSQALSLFPPV